MPDAASPHLCCDSRLVHQTAGPLQASADPSAADEGSVWKGQDEDTRMHQKQWSVSVRTAVTNPLTLLQLAVSSTGEAAC